MRTTAKPFPNHKTFGPCYQFWNTAHWDQLHQKMHMNLIYYYF